MIRMSATLKPSAVRFDDELKSAAVRQAKREGMTFAQVVRKALRAYLQANKGKTK